MQVTPAGVEAKTTPRPGILVSALCAGKRHKEGGGGGGGAQAETEDWLIRGAMKPLLSNHVKKQILPGRWVRRRNVALSFFLGSVSFLPASIVLVTVVLIQRPHTTQYSQVWAFGQSCSCHFSGSATSALGMIRNDTA